MRLQEVFYAAVGPEGQILTPDDGKSNGIYPTSGKAQAYLTKQLRQYQGWVASYDDGLARGVVYQPASLANQERLRERLKVLQASSVKEVKVVLVE